MSQPTFDSSCLITTHIGLHELRKLRTNCCNTTCNKIHIITCDRNATNLNNSINNRCLHNILENFKRVYRILRLDMKPSVISPELSEIVRHSCEQLYTIRFNTWEVETRTTRHALLVVCPAPQILKGCCVKQNSFANTRGHNS